MDWKQAWSTTTDTTNIVLDALTPICAPVAARWDMEADRRAKLRTPEHLKELMAAQRAWNSARSTSRQASAQRRTARKETSNPLSAARRAARTADKAARAHQRETRTSLKTAKANYPATLRRAAVRAHALHTVPAGIASWVMSEQAHALTIWPAGTSLGLIGLNVVALWLGRRTLAVQTPDGLSLEERQLVERLDPSYWVQHAEARGLDGTVTTPATVTRSGIEAGIRLDGQWTVKKLRAATDSVRALLGARTDLPMLIAAGSRGGWAVIRLRTRSAAPDGIIRWEPGAAFGVDMVTGEDVDVPLGKRMLIAGMSGAGKSTASRPLLAKASDGPVNVLVIIDLKKVEGRLWDHRARVAYTPDDVVQLVNDVVEELTERLDVLPKGQATLVPTAERPRITIVVDEGAEVISACTVVETVVGYTDKGAPITVKRNALDGLDSIARMGRAACIDLWWMTQSPTYNDGVPRQIAKQLGTRIGLAVESPTEARVVFGESAQEKGWKADELPLPGVAMVRDGKRGSDPVKVRYMDDDQVIALPAQTIWHRGTDAPAAPTDRPPLRLVKDPAPAAPAQAPATNRDRVLQAVRDGARTPRDITDRAGINKGTVSREIKALKAAGLIRRTDDGILMADTPNGHTGKASA
ncbi:MarR family transcriptional regulator [Streptomyces odontomachi]|uniref:MarR family transcriptional regulator n=1 Tax=Streptomyces odontomachi TaxID=2944940 RepID=UPI002109640F|nr:MarR family transcriptional regulator [Streptomyces sp. ODS25]